MKAINIKPKIIKIFRRNSNYGSNEIEILSDLDLITSSEIRKITKENYNKLTIIKFKYGSNLIKYWVLDNDLGLKWLIHVNSQLETKEIYFLVKNSEQFKELIKKESKENEE